ncbi:WD repeat-containing protein 48, partial [Tremellales sp. Uapishka_1]
MANTARRVSYILPSPTEPPPLLSLPPLGQPRNGQTNPLLQTKPDPRGFASKNPFAAAPVLEPPHPRHCLGVTSLAVDTSTVLANADSPGGILYTGGRDGLVASWELGISHRKRTGARYEGGKKVQWERIGDGAEMYDEDDDEDDLEDEESWSSEEEDLGDSWIGLSTNGKGRRRPAKGEVPYEDQWEVDKEDLAVHQPPPTRFRQSAQTHTDWVNAMLLCNFNQTVITASSDRTIRAWSPHTADLTPALIGRHRDYVRSLAWAKYPSLLFSGALDRTLSIWDINSNPDTPLLSIDMDKDSSDGSVSEGERGSVYALGVDPAGRILAAGTPERVVRLWDPRVGDKSMGKLVGHSDCVRSIVVSDDGRYMLTGSSDTTIKLWSLAAHRCLHTFNHHTSSVWALSSTHPNLERFYSGSRDGHLCVVDAEGVSDMFNGECVALAREGDTPLAGDDETKTGEEGIRSIVGMDDEFVWTATGSAEVRRWRDVGRRVKRLENDLDGVAYNFGRRGSDAVALGGLGSAFHLNPTEGLLRTKRSSGEHTDGLGLETSLRTDARSVVFANTTSPSSLKEKDSNASPNGPLFPSALRERLNLPTPRRTTFSGSSIAGSIMSDSSANGDDGPMPVPQSTLTFNGIPYQSLVSLGQPDSPYSFGFLPHRESVQPGGSMSSVPRGLNTMLKPNDGSPRGYSSHTDRDTSLSQVARMKFESREVASEAVPLRRKPDEVIAGRTGLIRSLLLNDRQHVLTLDTAGQVSVWNIIRGTCVGRFADEDVVQALDLERGEIKKHSQEVLELIKERVEGETLVITWCGVDTKIGSLTVHLEEGRVFDAEVYADELGPVAAALDGDSRVNLGKWTLANLFQGLIKAEENEVTAIGGTPSTTASSLPSIQRTPAPAHIAIDRPLRSPTHRTRALSGTFIPGTPSINMIGLATPAATPAILPELSSSVPTSSGWHSLSQAMKTGPLSAIPQSPSMDNGGGGRDYFSVKKPQETSPERDRERQPPTTPGGSFMGKFKGFGKKKTLDTPMSTVAEVQQEAPTEDDTPKVDDRESAQLRLLDAVRAHAFHPPAPWEAPPLAFPPSTSLLISEEARDAGAWAVTYRSQVSSTERDMEPLEMNSPFWLLDYLFTSRVKPKEPVKLTFILEPAPGSGLKEMPENTGRLSASRVLRAKKIMGFIVDRLELDPVKNGIERPRANSTASQIRRSSIVSSNGRGPVEDGTPPDEIVELICGDAVVSPTITLATLKHYYGSGGDMTLLYRLKGK